MLVFLTTAEAAAIADRKNTGADLDLRYSRHIQQIQHLPPIGFTSDTVDTVNTALRARHEASPSSIILRHVLLMAVARVGLTLFKGVPREKLRAWGSRGCTARPPTTHC